MNIVDRIHLEKLNAFKRTDAPMFLILDKESNKKLILQEAQKSDMVSDDGGGIITINTFLGLRVSILNYSKGEEIWVF